MKTRAFGVLLALAIAMPATVFAQGIPRLTVGRMEVKDSAKFITIKSSPWVVGSCPGGEGKAAYNPGYELWDADGYKESHWGFGALRLSTEKSGARFFGSVSKWPTKGERVLMGYAKSAGGAVTVGGKALGKNWQLIKIPFSGGRVPDTPGGSGTALLDDWIMGDHFTTIEYSVDGKDVSSVELYRIVPPQPGARRVRKNTAVLVRKDNVPDGLTIKIKAEGTDTTLRYFFKVNRRTGGTVKILYPTNADSLLRASIPLKHAITARLRTTVLKNIMFYDEPKAAQIQITSTANRQLKGKVKMYLVDFWGKIVDTQSFAINMKPGGRFAKNYTIPKGLRGYFTGAFEIKLDKGETLWLIPRSFGSPDPTGAEGEPKFPPRGKWAEQVARSAICIIPRRKPGFKDPDLCYISVYGWTQMNELYGRLGTGLQMLEVTGYWSKSNPAPAYDKATYTPGRKMGISFFLRPWRDDKNGISAPKDMKAFGKFVFEVADYFTKKGATHFDTWNEPEYWFKGSRRKLAETMRETYMNIKRANPKAKVCGPGIMGTGYFASTLKEVKKLCEEEGLEEHFPFFDMHSVHYSRFPFETAYVGFIRSHRKVMRRFGLPDEMPIWNTENGLPGSRSLNNPSQHVPAMFWYNAAKYLTRQVLVGISENMTHHTVFMGGSMIQQHGSVNSKDWNMSNWEPTQLYASTAVFCDQIEMTKYQKKLDLGENVWAMEFRRKSGGRTIALWTFEDTSKSPWANRRVTVKVPVKSATVALVDLMGTITKLTGKDGVVEVAIDGNPSYLQDPPRKN